MIKLFLASIFAFFLAGCGGGSETAVPVGLELNASQQFATERLAAEQQDNQPIYINGKLWPKGTNIHLQAYTGPTAEQLAATKAAQDALEAARWAEDPVKAAREDAEQAATRKRVALLSLQTPYMDGLRVYPTVGAAAADGVPAAREALAVLTAQAEGPLKP